MQAKTNGPYIPTKAGRKWVFSDAEWEDVRKACGNEIVAWAKVPPIGKKAKEFAPPEWMRPDYAKVFFWKLADPGCDCIANHRKSLPGLAIICDDVLYWQKRWSESSTVARVLQSTAATAIGDYRSSINEKKLCPESAKLRLQAISKDVVYQIFLGRFQMMSPQGLKGAGQLDGQIVDILNKSCSR